MAKEIILYNLAKHVSDEQYKDYVLKEKGPLLESLPSVEKFQLIKIKGSASGDIPYKYVGILNIKDPDQFSKEDAPSPKFQNFLKKWQTMVSDFHILMGEEIY